MMATRGSKKKSKKSLISDVNTCDACLIINEYDSMVDDLLQILTSVLKVSVYPRYRNMRNRIYRFEEFDDLKELYKHSYEQDIKSIIKDSRVTIAVVNKKFSNSTECMDLLKYAKRIRRPVIGLVVEECDNYEKLSKSFQVTWEIYEDRINRVGYDQYLWIGENFNSFLRDVATKLEKKFTKPRNMNKAYYCFSINNETNLGETLRLFSLIASQLGHEHQIKYYENMSKNIDSVDTQIEARVYADISELNVSNKIDTEDAFRQILFFDYYEAKLEYLNVNNKDDYLRLLHCFEELLKETIIELARDSDLSKITVSEEDKSCSARFIEISRRINSAYGHDRTFLNVPSPTLFYIVFKNIKEKLSKMEIDPIKIENVFRFMNANDSFYLYEALIRSKIIIIFLTKEFFDSQKYKTLFEKFSKMRKKIFILKFDDVDLNLTARLKKSVKVYDVYRHKIDKFDGYLTRNFLVDVKDALKAKQITKQFQYRINTDIFMCNLEDEYDDLLNKIKENGFKIRNRMKISDPNELKDAIEKSRIVIFVLTNLYIKTDEFQNLLEASRNEKKVLIFILAESIDSTIVKNEKISIDMNQMNVINFYKNSKDKEILCNGEEFYRLCYFIYSIIGRQDLVSICKETIQLESFESNKRKTFHQLQRYRLPIHSLVMKKNLKDKSRQIGCLFEFEERNEVLITIGDRLLIYDSTKYEYMRQISLRSINESSIKDIFYHRDTNQLCLLGDCTLYYLNVEIDEYHISSICQLDSGCFQDSFFHLFAYNSDNNKIYLFNMSSSEIMLTEGMHVIRKVEIKGEKNLFINSIKYLNNYLYVLKNNCVLVYDSNLEYVTSFGNLILSKATCLIIDKKTPNYLYILESEEKCLKAFNFSFKYLGKIKIDCNLLWDRNCKGDIINGHLVLYDNLNMYIQEINYSFSEQNSSKSDLNGFFICKLNKFNYHMCRNPYLLPCGNIACLECVYDNYNLHVNKFQCNFEDCKIMHELNEKIEKINVTDDKVKSICFYQLDNAINCPTSSDYIADKLESFENWFNFIDEDLDIRHESLNIQIDELQEITLKMVDETERKLIEKLDKCQEPLAKRSRTVRNEIKVQTTMKNFPFKSLNSIQNTNIGFVRDDNRDFKTSVDEEIESSINSDEDDDSDNGWGSYMTDSDDYMDGFGWNHDYFNEYDDDDEDDYGEDSNNCTIQ